VRETRTRGVVFALLDTGPGASAELREFAHQRAEPEPEPVEPPDSDTERMPAADLGLGKGGRSIVGTIPNPTPALPTDVGRERQPTRG
jgi:hypothetical protein